jgi:hypothetical protein
MKDEDIVTVIEQEVARLRAIEVKYVELQAELESWKVREKYMANANAELREEIKYLMLPEREQMLSKATAELERIKPAAQAVVIKHGSKEGELKNLAAALEVEK